MAVTIKVNGLRELRERLRRLPLEVRKKAARKAVGKAAQIVKKAAILQTPLGATGTLRRAALVNYRKRDSTDDKTVYIVTYRRGKRYQERVSKKGRRIASTDAYYASWVEFGHRIVPRKGGSLRARRRAATGRVPGRHFLRDSFAGQVQPAINAISGELQAFFAEVRP
jgi:HK97 gp10 family phage protein